MTTTTEEFDKRPSKVLSMFKCEKPRKKIVLKFFLWTRRMKSWQPCPKHFTVRPNAQDPKLFEKIEFFLKRSLDFQKYLLPSKNCPHGLLESSFDNRVEIFTEKRWNLFAQGPKKMKKTCSFFKELIISKMFLRALSMHFRKPYQKYSTKNWKHLAQGSKKNWITRLFQLGFLLNFLLSVQKMLFWQPCRVFFSDTRRNLFTSMSITEKNIPFLSKGSNFPQKSNCTAGQIECSFDYPTEKKLTKGRTTFAHCLKTMQKNDSANMFFLKVHICSGKMHFWQGSWKFLPGMTKMFAQSPKKTNKKRFRISKKVAKTFPFSPRKTFVLKMFL